MADPIREALERLVAADEFVGEASPQYQQARDAARDALDAAPEGSWHEAAITSSDRPANPADPIRAALDALEEYDAADPYHDCRGILAAARRAISSSDGPAPVTERDVSEWINSQPLWHGATRDELVSIVMQALARWGRPTVQAPAPATDAPLDLDALLSPEGAYMRGTGPVDGAQLATGPHGGNPQWWEPLYGCDTLETLLCQIRDRILPHLRPPIGGIDVPGGDGDYGDVLDLCAAEGVDLRVGVPLLKRAREAWFPTTPPTPPAAGEACPSEEEWDALVERVWDAHQRIGYQGECFMWDTSFSLAAAALRDELARWGTANSAQISSSLAVVQAIREEILRLDSGVLNSDQINLVLSIIDNHLP